MIAVQEVTKWVDIEYSEPNHIYLLEGDRVHAYIPKGADTARYFKKPLRIDQRRRKFVKLDYNPFDTTVKSNLIKVLGSKGNEYFIDPDAQTCSCPGFTFRNTCKHIKEYV